MQFTLYTKKDKDIWFRDFLLCIENIKKSNDSKKLNYWPKNFNIDAQDEISVIYYENKLIAFSSLYTSSDYPPGHYRVLNRSYKDPEFRWGKPAYYVLSDLMIKPQIARAQELNATCVFVSSEGNRGRWLKKWVSGANENGLNFIQILGMVKVCNAPSYKRCYQNLAYMALKDNANIEFQTISYESWHEKILNEN